MLEFGLLLFFPFFMIYAAASDLFTMTISNKISIFLMAGFMVFAIWLSFSWQTILMHWAAFSLVLGIGFSLFALGAMGGGDVKLASSTALWFGWEHLLEYVIFTSFVGAVLSLLFVFARTRHVPEIIAKWEWVRRLYNHTHVPYGIALGAGAILVYPNTSWMQHVFDQALIN